MTQENNKKKQFVSLGMSCQTANQLGVLSEKFPEHFSQETSLFDWIICPPDQFVLWLNSGMELFKREDISLYREHAYWEKYKTWFWHGFYQKVGDERILDIAGRMDKELEKFAARKEKFLKTDVSKTIFVLSNTQNNLEGAIYPRDRSELHNYHFTKEKVSNFQKALDSFFKSSCQLVVVAYEERSSDDLKELENVYFLKKDSSDWKGDSEPWEKILHSLL